MVSALSRAWRPRGVDLVQIQRLVHGPDEDSAFRRRFEHRLIDLPGLLQLVFGGPRQHRHEMRPTRFRQTLADRRRIATVEDDHVPAPRPQRRVEFRRGPHLRGLIADLLHALLDRLCAEGSGQIGARDHIHEDGGRAPFCRRSLETCAETEIEVLVAAGGNTVRCGHADDEEHSRNERARHHVVPPGSWCVATAHGVQLFEGGKPTRLTATRNVGSVRMESHARSTFRNTSPGERASRASPR